MKISIRDIQFANTVIGRHGGVEGDARVKIARISRSVRMEAEVIQEAISSLVRDHAERDAGGKMVTVQTAMGPDTTIKDPQAFQAAHKTLRLETIEIAVEPLTLDEWKSIKGPSDILDALLPFVADK